MLLVGALLVVTMEVAELVVAVGLQRRRHLGSRAQRAGDPGRRAAEGPAERGRGARVASRPLLGRWGWAAAGGRQRGEGGRWSLGAQREGASRRGMEGGRERAVGMHGGRHCTSIEHQPLDMVE